MFTYCVNVLKFKIYFEKINFYEETIMNYNETMEYIEQMHVLGSNYGTERTEKILEILGNPHKKLKCIHIAGTNGKGSITAMTTQILITAGYKVGMYTSPFIEEFEERIQINGQNIPKDELAKSVTKVAKAVEEVIKMGYETPTEFEVITCAMFLYFYEQNVDYAVIEVGLGGRLDSTNVLNPIACVIASISLDHMQILGEKIEKIATEKAGIIKENSSVVIYPQVQEAYDCIVEVANKKSAKVIKVDKGCVIEEKITKNSGYQNITIKTEKDTYNVDLHLLGVHQKLNCATVIYLVEELIQKGIAISKQNIIDGLKNVVWKARLEIMNEKPLVVIDGGHNIDGIKNLTKSVEKYFEYKNLTLILGILADKQVDDMIKTIIPLAKNVIAVSPHSERAKDAFALKDIILNYNKNCEAIQDYEQAYQKALSYVDKDDMLLVAGSLYLMGDMRKVIKKLEVK